MNTYLITVKDTSIRILVAYVDGKLLSIDNVTNLEAQAWDLIKGWISADEQVTLKRFDVFMAIPSSHLKIEQLQPKTNRTDET